MFSMHAMLRNGRALGLPWRGKLSYVVVFCMPIILFLFFGTNKRVYIVIKTEQEQTVLQELLVTQKVTPYFQLNEADFKEPDEALVHTNNTLVQYEDEETTRDILPTVTTERLVLETTTKKPTKINCSTIPDELVCEPNEPCMYEDEVDLRVIVIVYDRADSLRVALEHLQALELGESKAKMEIWLDCSKSGFANLATYEVAKSFTWAKGSSRVHVWKSHVGIYGQFTDTWGPRKGTKEAALIVEDDVDIAPVAWKWLKAAKNKYDKVPKISGYALCERRRAPVSDTPVYLSRHSETWGFAPKPDVYADFQKWFHVVRQDRDFHPRLKEDKRRSKLYDKFEKDESMWTMWYQYFLQMRDIYAMNPRMRSMTGRQPNVLAYNRQERGLHFNGANRVVLKRERLLEDWSKKYVHFHDSVPVVNYDMSYYRTLNTVNNTEYLDEKYTSKEEKTDK